MAEQIPRRQSSTSSRHSFDRQPFLPYSNPDIFSDDFALEALGPTDGFRPSASSHEPTPRPHTPPRNTRTPSLRLYPSAPQLNDGFRRPKGLGGPSRGNSVSQNNGLSSQLPRRTPSMVSRSDYTEIAPSHQRQLSVNSNFSMPRRTQSPYQGATGPSHPYGMYPQDIGLGRSSTTSTIRPPERSYVGPDGPAHPYGMYSQNTVPEGEADSDGAAPIVPVGFPGLGQQYTRRLGPDGEDVDDIIGPDGHTEQLPAYTRYPNAEGGQDRYVPGVLPPIMQESSPTLSGHRSSPVLTDHASSPGLGINGFSPVLGGHATSSGPTDPTRTRESVNDSLNSDDNGPINLAATSAASNGSGSFKEKFIEKSKKPTCCGRVPRWAMCLIVFLSVALAVSLAGSLGRWISRKENKDPTATSWPASSPSPEA